MYQVACPGCGAPVTFRSAASVMAVCEFCRTTVLKDADSVRDLGKMAEVLEDYSPIRIGVSGTFNQHAFTVIGRIQLRYAAGFWNEWYVLSDEGRPAWLSDASGQYAVTAEAPAIANPPKFDGLRAGTRVHLGDAVYVASDVRSAKCVAGQGELPFQVGAGWETRVADFRRGNQFLTLDYADGDPPKIYRGKAVRLDELKCQLLRAPDEIRDTAGRFKGKVGSLACPSCGAAANYSPGATTHLVCPSCRAQIDTSGAVAEVIAAGARMAAVRTTLELGAKATIDREPWTLIGLMRREELGEEGEDSRWTEYLLYSEKRGFRWLVETSEGWERADVLDEWPQWDGGSQATLPDGGYSKIWDYQARVIFAAGAFNWRVAVGDTVRVTEYRNGDAKLSMEANAEEITWSRAIALNPDEVMAWFGKAKPVGAALKAKAAESAAGTTHVEMAKRIMWFLFGINAIPFVVNPDDTFGYVLFGLVALFLPAFVLDVLKPAMPGKGAGK